LDHPLGAALGPHRHGGRRPLALRAGIPTRPTPVRWTDAGDGCRRLAPLGPTVQLLSAKLCGTTSGERACSTDRTAAPSTAARPAVTDCAMVRCSLDSGVVRV